MKPLILSDVHLNLVFRELNNLQRIKNAFAPSAVEIDFLDSFSLGLSCLPPVEEFPAAAADSPADWQVSRAEEGSQGQAAHGSRHWADHCALVECYSVADSQSRLQVPGSAAVR